MANEAWAFRFIRNLCSWGIVSPDGIKCTGVNLMPITFKHQGIITWHEGSCCSLCTWYLQPRGGGCCWTPALPALHASCERLEPSLHGRWAEGTGRSEEEGVGCCWYLQDSRSAGGGRAPARPRGWMSSTARPLPKPTSRSTASLPLLSSGIRLNV